MVHTNWGVIGHSWAIEHLTRSLNHGRVRHAYLITGPEGIGKTTLARGFARALNCLSDEARPCGKCRSCTMIDAGIYPDVNLIETDGDTLRIEQIRDMQHTLSLRPVEARYRVVILRRFDRASAPAMDSLLKTLEEPAPYVVLLLTANTTDTLLPTIRSRCQPLNLRPLATSQVRTALQMRIESERAALLATLSGGRIGWAFRAADDVSLLADRTILLDMLEAAISGTRVKRFALVDELTRDRDKAGLQSALSIWQGYWRDVLLMAHSTTTASTNRDRHQTMQQLANTLKVDDIYRVLQAIGRTAKYVGQNVNPRLTLEVLMLDLPYAHLVTPPG
ncbi:MAG TPA: DNA polymerase III subunit delta' [Aggregatilineales bacterium]|nr:DNA polymerase III subunit delta' [Aggregatilineales bacterium]